MTGVGVRSSSDILNDSSCNPSELCPFIGRVNGRGKLRFDIGFEFHCNSPNISEIVNDFEGIK